MKPNTYIVIIFVLLAILVVLLFTKINSPSTFDRNIACMNYGEVKYSNDKGITQMKFFYSKKLNACLVEFHFEMEKEEAGMLSYLDGNFKSDEVILLSLGEKCPEWLKKQLCIASLEEFKKRVEGYR